MPKQLLGSVQQVLTGQVRTVAAFAESSAINKQPVSGPVEVTALGVAGDQQGDLSVHGGPEKAVHLYPFEHYGYWQSRGVKHPLLQQAGAFGENLSTLGVTEETICIGDKIQIGSAVFEVSQGRQPCWKLNLHFAQPGFARRVQDEIKTGWYFRVLTPGLIQAGDALELIERPLPQWTMHRVMELLYRPCLDPEELKEAQSLPLGDSWQRLIGRRLETGQVENWQPRLEKNAS